MILERQNIMPQIDSTRTGNIKSYRYSSRREQKWKTTSARGIQTFKVPYNGTRVRLRQNASTAVSRTEECVLSAEGVDCI